MGLDIRKPIAYLFGILSVLLIGQGVLAPPTAQDSVHAININLYWGVVMLAFAALMFVLARSGSSE